MPNEILNRMKWNHGLHYVFVTTERPLSPQETDALCEKYFDAHQQVALPGEALLVDLRSPFQTPAIDMMSKTFFSVPVGFPIVRGQAFSDQDNARKSETVDMLLLFKPKITAREIAEVFLKGIQKDVGNGYANKPLIHDAKQEDLPNIRQEWFYFDVFNVDYFVYLALGQTAEKKAILDLFWSQTMEWIETSRVPAMPERIGPYAGGLKIIPAEKEEPTCDRLTRRCNTYMEAINKPHSLGENHGVGLMLAILCGELGLPFVAGVSSFFHVRKTEWIKMLRSYRITIR